MQRYPIDSLWDELTYLAYHLHWSLDELLDLEHADRQRLVQRIGALQNRERLHASRPVSGPPPSPTHPRPMP